MKLVYQVDDGVGAITLTNPPYNSLRRPRFEDIDVLRGFLARDELRGVVVRGDGRHFCAGADLVELERLRQEPEALARELDQGRELLEALGLATVPVVAAIRGSCLGAGLEIALACHFRVASENSILGFPESSLGLMPGLGGTAMAPRVLSRAAAIDLLVSGRMIDASEARDIGLVDRVVPTRDVDGIARELLVTLVERRPTHVIRAVMEAVHNARRLSPDAALREEGRLFLQVARETARRRLEEGDR
jgi:enoyl-CoA hydratase/carnithine racemase